MMRFLVLMFFLTIEIYYSSAQNSPLTIAESSGFRSTSYHKDVISFIGELKKISPFIRTESIATSVEGKEIPLIIIGNPLPSSPADLRNDPRIKVYIQANIHAGEVEGKEAALMYARDILKDRNSAVLKSCILLICPDFNPDGNDKISTLNRTNQNGPENGVGLRHNGQFLDINRDGMKAESPEMRGLLRNVFNRWDPEIFMDCHTTNGSYHVEPVTFTWAVNPNGDNNIIRYMRDRMMPEVHSTLQNKYKVENCFYGEFIDMLQPEKGWILDVPEPRYLSNYYGLRNRIGILNENYVYADYKSRVMGCYYLIHSLMDYAVAHGAEVKKMISEADAATVSRGMKPGDGDSVGIKFDVKAAPEKVLVKTYEAEAAGEMNGWRTYRKTDRRKDVTIPYFVDWYPVKSVKFPFAYLLTIPDPDILSLLDDHGIRVEKLKSAMNVEAECFIPSDIKPAARLNQGHYTNTITGRYEIKNISFPAGTYVIRTSQPLANIAAYLLEPESADGLVFWNYLDKYLVPQWGAGFNTFPVYRVLKRVDFIFEEI